MERPKCRLCGTRHYGYEPHEFGVTRKDSAIKPVTTRQKAVTPVTQSVTHSVTPVTEVTHKRLHNCPMCRCTKVYPSNAEKQRAYRERKANGVSSRKD